MVKKVKNKEILIKVLCLLVSFGLWLYINNIENPVSERVITNIPVEILNTQVLAEDGLALSPNQNVSISLTVSGPTGDIYKINKSQFRIVADLVSYGLKPGENNIPINILNSPSGVNVKNNYPRAEINLENLQKKTMPIYSEINVKNSTGTYVKNVKISPLSATVEGAESLVTEVSKLVVQGEVKEINQSTVLNLPIVAVNSSGVAIKGVKITPTQADVAINLEQGRAVPIKVTTEGTLPTNLTLKSITPSINSVDIVGTDSDKIAALSTTPIDLSKITGNATIPVTITVPPGIVNISGKETVNVNVVVANNIASKNLSLPIKIIGQKEGYSYKIAKNTAEVTFTGAPQIIDTLDISKLSCQIDVATLEKTGIVPISVIGQALDGVTIKINPATIQVDVAKDEVKPPIVEDSGNTENPVIKPDDVQKPVENADTKPKPIASAKKEDSSKPNNTNVDSSSNKKTNVDSSSNTNKIPPVQLDTTKTTDENKSK
ncbi:CdaR family protein [uncultured Clostridium sp.]|uniref:CdaR family protein n=1 Tax=uncultured Clostridium sp. TaxID=59620 RepID=UPI00262F6114|nr:CdaR family protein [uncultured Clostridium sp.]